METGSLSHLKIIDLSQNITGPYCSKLLSGFGARVIKIEKPETGDRMRGIGPFFHDSEDLEMSIPFLWLNTGKKSITLNLETEKGKDLLKRLVADADILIESFTPGIMADLGFDYESISQINFKLIMTSISNFGQNGLYKNYEAEEIQLYALSGLMYETGDSDKAPLAPGPALSQYTGGISAYIAILMAVFQREITGQGQHVDLSIQEAAMNNIEMSLVENLQMGKIKGRNSNHHLMVPWELYDCSDGQAALIGGPIRHWLRGAELFEEPRLLEKKFEHALNRIENRREFEELLIPCVKRWKKKDLFHAGQKNKLAFGYLAELDEVLDSPQLKERHFFEQIYHPKVGKHQYCSAPFKLSKASWYSGQTPLLGEHNEDIYSEILGLSAMEIEQLREEGVI